MNQQQNFNIKSFLPLPVLQFAKTIKRFLKSLRRSFLRLINKKSDYNTLIADLVSAGIKPGDSVLVHCRFSSLGYVEGGAITLIKALETVVGESGTLLFPTFPANSLNKTYMDHKPVFDVKNTPSAMGIVTEVFRKMKNVKRSFHPTDPVAAKGKLAEYYTSDHYNQITPYNANSPFYKLVEQHGKILMIGVGLESCTNLHTLEDAVEFKFPVYLEKIYEAKMIDENGILSVMKTKVHNPEYSVKRRCNDLFKMFTDEGVVTKTNIGEANALVLDAYKMHQSMLNNYLKRGITMYTPFGS